LKSNLLKRRLAIPELQAIKKQYERKWLKFDEVVSVGIGLTSQGKVGVIVAVSRNPEKIRKKIPLKIKGYPIEIQLAGEVRAQNHE